MYILIGGGGQVGYYLVKGLLQQGHEVVLLERDPRRVERLSEELESSVIRGDACEVSTLDEVGCSRADVVVAVTGDDEDNLVICQLAKERYGVPRTIARVNNPRYNELFRTLGIDVTVSPTRTILSMIEAEIPHHTLVPLMTLSKAGMGLVEINVPPESPVVGRALKDLKLPNSVNVALIVRGDQNITPSGDTQLQSDDRLYALVTREGEAALRETILREASPAPALG